MMKLLSGITILLRLPLWIFRGRKFFVGRIIDFVFRNLSSDLGFQRLEFEI
jgi:hypothetical protein